MSSVYSVATRENIIELLRTEVPAIFGHRLPDRWTEPLRVLSEDGITTGHYDPAFFLLAEWMKVDADFIADVITMSGVALFHGQTTPVSFSPETAIGQIFTNILRQHYQMKRTWWYRNSRTISHRPPEVAEFWRLTGLWFQRMRVTDGRIEQTEYDWYITTVIPEAMLFNFSKAHVVYTSILPGPLPPQRIEFSGRREELRQVLADQFDGSWIRYADWIEDHFRKS